MEKLIQLNKKITGIYGPKFLPMFSLIFIVGCISSVAQFISTYYLGKIIDDINLGFSSVMRTFIIIGIVTMIYIVGNALWTFASGKMINRFMLNLRLKLGNILCSSEFSQLEKYKDGEILSTVTNDTEGFRPYLLAVFKIGYLPAEFFLCIIFMFLINWKLILLLIPVIPMIIFVNYLLSGKLHSLNLSERQTIGKTTGFINSTIQFCIVVKSFCLESVFLSNNRKLLDDVLKANQRKTLRERIISFYGTATGYLFFVVLFAISAYFILKGEMTIGELITIIFLGNLMGEGLNIIQVLPPNYQAARACMTRIDNILNLTMEKTTGKASSTKEASQAIFEIKNLYFSYGEKRILTDINFSVRRGEKIAVVGVSGSGKTTMFKLLCGLYQPTQGVVCFNGDDLSTLSLDKFRNNLSVVTQEAFLFSDTIRSNIKIGTLTASDKEMIEASKHACIHDYIISLEKGYDTHLLDPNKSMSKGQMQRINIARAFLKNSSVFLLDEPTSALDIPLHEKIMNFALEGLKDKTVITIIHRLTNPERFDRILVMENGYIVGFATHLELISSNDQYRVMLDRMSQTTAIMGGDLSESID
ncbi:MAG TPA: ABC transporter ATP-binding protein [Clostridiaceae bacterium]